MVTRTRSFSFAFNESDMPVRFGRYLLLKRKGAEPIGEDFLTAWGVDEGIDQLRILRGIYPAVADESQFVALFSEEARTLSRLASANVVRVIEVSIEGGIPFVATEYVEGLTLERLVELSREAESQCSWELAAHITAELLRGLDYVHHREDILGSPMGMRHGDVRPANVLISFGGEVKLTNFGSALYFIVDERTNARLQTYRGIYAPPEYSKVDAATVGGDLWGVSAIFATLLGRHTLIDTTGRAVDLTGVMPNALDSFLAKALSRDPDSRFADAASMRDALLEIMQANIAGHPPDDLADWTTRLGNKDRDDEKNFIRAMLQQDAQMNLDDTADGGSLGPGTILDSRYHLIRMLGEGGMGQVFEAEHLGIERKVAIKVLHERILDDAVAVERFRREAKITGSLGHPNIVGVSDFGVTSEGHHYLVMELLKGESLADLIERGTIAPLELASIIAHVCDGLEAAHQAGVVHRDLKPENIFLTEMGPCIVDFGIAKRTGLEDEEQSLTRSGYVCGTAEYLAPEQVQGQTPDHRCDVYAAGVMIYEALTGNTPFRGRTVGETLQKVMNDKAVPPRKLTGNKSIPRDLEDICLKALSRKPEKRFNSALEMGKELRAMLFSDEAGSEIPSLPKKRSALYWVTLFLVVFLSMIAALALFAVGRRIFATTNSVPITEKDLVLDETGLVEAQKDKPKTVVVLPKPDEGQGQNIKTKEEAAVAPLIEPKKAKASEPRFSPKKRIEEMIANGDAELKKMHVKEAIRAYKEATRLDPRVARGWYGLGRAAIQQDRYQDAVKHIQHALRLSPGQRRWRIYLGQLYMTNGQKQKAVKEWKRVLDTHPGDQEVIKLLARVGVKVD